MQIVRTILWVMFAIWGLFFFAMNWGAPVPVKFWPIPLDNPLLFEWPVSLVAVVFFLLGFVPMWLYFRGARWGLNRRIQSLENAARSSVVTAPVQPAEPAAETLAEEAELSPEIRQPLA